MSIQTITNAPVYIRAFPGCDVNVQKSLNQNVPFTPDCNGAVNNQYYVQMINGVFTVYDKNGNLKEQVSDQVFWQKAGISQPGNIVDPRIMFIPSAGQNGKGQWLAACLQLGYLVYIATTSPYDDTADPSIGKWSASQIPLKGNDFTMLGYDASGVYIGCNGGDDDSARNKANSEAAEEEKDEQRYPQVICIPRIYALNSPPSVKPDLITVFKKLPGQQYGTGLYPVSDPGSPAWNYSTFIGTDNEGRASLTFALYSNELHIMASTGRLKVPPFTPLPIYARIIQPSNEQTTFFSTDVFSAPIYCIDSYNFWCAHTVQPSTVQRMYIRWYHIQLDTATRMPFVANQGEIRHPNYDYFNPAIISLGVNDYTLISFSRSGDGSTPTKPSDDNCGNIGAYLAILNNNNPSAPPVIQTLQAGAVGNYLAQNGNRWGDFNTICKDPDPNFPRRYWVTNQYVTGSDTWGTIIASIDVDKI